MRLPSPVAQPFLWVSHSYHNPNHHLLIPGLPIPVPAFLIFPLLAAATTFVQSKMLQQPMPPNATEQELQTQQMQRTMVWLSPIMIAVFALQVPAGLGIYWFIGNCVSIIQQYFVVGRGNLCRPPEGEAGPAQAGAPAKGGGGPGVGT